MIDDVGRDKVAFLMPEANGPCRFGQYRHLIRRTLDDLGYTDVPVITITSNDGYSSIGQYSQDLIRTAWRAVVAHDALMKMLLRTRPYELEPGAADQAYLDGLREVGAALVAARRVPQGAAGRDGAPRWSRRATGSAPFRRATTARAP